MKIKRIEHIAIALKNMDTIKDVLANKLGIAMEYEEHLPAHATTLAMFPVGETYLELLQSDKADSAPTSGSPSAARGSSISASKSMISTSPCASCAARAYASRPNNRSLATATAASSSWIPQRRVGSSLSWRSNQRPRQHRLAASGSFSLMQRLRGPSASPRLPACLIGFCAPHLILTS